MSKLRMIFVKKKTVEKSIEPKRKSKSPFTSSTLKTKKQTLKTSLYKLGKD